jgi:outer membrane protein assembly factor BamD
MRFTRTLYSAVISAAVILLLSGCGLKRHKYDDPITKNTQQPDKVLFDRAINDIEHSRYEVARLTLQTLMNTYDTSEYLAKAKLAVADSWFREGGAHGLAQAEAEYKDFILFYPMMEESAEAQERVCDIHYKQMDKADRDPIHAIKAEEECRQLMLQFPNSKFAPETQQKLRNIQEVLAAHEYAAGVFYHHKGSYPAAANRLVGMVDQYPLFSQADEALWMLGDCYTRMGDRFEDKAAAAWTRIVRDYPLSPHADAAKENLQAMKAPVPQADPVAYARMKYELENRTSSGFVSHFFDAFKKNPDTSLAAKSGTPAMTALRPPIPASVPQPINTSTGVSDVSATTVGDSKELDSRPDARLNPPAAGNASTAAGGNAAPAAAPGAAAATGTTGANGGTQVTGAAATETAPDAAPKYAPLATNHPVKPKKQKKTKKKSDQQATPQAQPQTQQPAATTGQPVQAQTPPAPAQPQK